MNLGQIHVDFGKTLKIRLRCLDASQGEALIAYLGHHPPPNIIPTIEEEEDRLKVSWGRKAAMLIHLMKEDGGHIYQIEWTVNPDTGPKVLMDTFDLQGAHWYGGAQVRMFHWPIEKWTHEVSPYVPMDSFRAGQWGGVQERYWVNSKGAAIFVNKDVPLFVGLNGKHDQKLKLIAKLESPYREVENSKVYLKYSIFLSDNVRNVHDLASRRMIPNPDAIPDEALFRYPIWSTWAQYKTNINQDIVIEYADNIRSHDFIAAQLEIDDDWTPKYGDMTFDPEKFPDPQKMVDELKARGCRVTLWVHPFCSPASQAFFSGVGGDNLWVSSGPMPGMTTWWNGLGKALDVTNPSAATWFKAQLKELRTNYGIASFKFDAGEINWLPTWFRLHKQECNPTVYTRSWVKLAYDMDRLTRCQEVRVGCQTQKVPIFVRMMDKDSNWGFDNGLKTLIPHVLTFGLIGYPFCLPDMIGGNAHDSTGKPDRELYIRWLQANVFMPSMQFSIPPWEYDKEVVEIAHKMTELHEFFSDKMIELAKESTVNGSPINRPLWWIAPRDSVALTIDSEFLLGDEVLIAPILESGARKRDIYLPAGTWRDELRGGEVDGGGWLSDYKVDISELPYFTKLPPEGASASQP